MTRRIPSDLDGIIQEQEIPTEYEEVLEDEVEDKFLEDWDSDEMQEGEGEEEK